MDISIIEWIVYGIPAYTGIILLIISAFRETPATKTQSLVRAMYLMISIICSFILAGSGVNITTQTPDTVNTLGYNVTDGTLLSNMTSYGVAPAAIVLQNPVWILVHWMFAVLMLVYVILQILMLFTKID